MSRTMKIFASDQPHSSVAIMKYDEASGKTIHVIQTDLPTRRFQSRLRLTGRGMVGLHSLGALGDGVETAGERRMAA